MYEEWFDSMPILISGCYEHNAEQLQRAANYWERNGDLEHAEKCQELAIQERNKAIAEKEKKENKKWHWGYKFV